MKKLLVTLLVLAFAVVAFGQITGKYFGFTPDRYWDNNGVFKTDARVWIYGSSGALRVGYDDSVYANLSQASTGALTLALTGGTAPGLNVTLTGTNTYTSRAITGATITPASFSSGNLVGARGSITMPNSSSITGGYLYGIQGKAITGTGAFSGTVLTGVFAQLDVTGGTITAGHASALQSNLYGANSGAWANLTGLYIEHAGGGVIDSLIEVFGKSDYVFRIASNTHTQVSTTGTVGTTAAKGWLKIIVDGAVRYIPLADSVS
jgi:hypothetical protein